MNINKELLMQLLYLIVCAMHSEKPNRQKVAAMDLQKLYQLAKFHSVTGICATALEMLWAEVPELCTDEWRGEVEKQMRRSVLLDMECQEICRLLEENKIWYLPLKGALLNSFYPKYGMRQMSDFDIFYDKACQKKVLDLMTKRGYKKHKDSSIVDKYLKEPIYNFEFHRALVTTQNEIWHEYYRDSEKRLLQDNGSEYRRCFSDEDFYIYLIVHANKHYEDSGIGIRTLPDCYAYLKAKKESMDWQYITEECEKLGIAQFESELRLLTEAVFNSDKPTLTAKQEDMLIYLMSSGTYGTAQNNFDKRWEKLNTGKGSKFKYIWSRLFPDMQTVKRFFPFFYKHRWALPVLWVFRLVRMALFRRDVLVKDLKMLKKK